MKCYKCANEATTECRRCGRLYCDEHGDEFCGECLKPSGALPSFLLYRGSLLALLVGTVVALFLLLKPPPAANETNIKVVEPTATAQSKATKAPSENATPSGEATAVETPEETPAADVTPAPGQTATPGTGTYTVQEGDTLYGIAAQFQPAGEALGDYANRLAEANGIDPANPVLQPGQVLTIPK
jgi:nucleoid-associated protein YgaU